MQRSVKSMVATRTYLGYLIALREQNVLGLQVVVHLQQTACQAMSNHHDTALRVELPCGASNYESSATSRS